MRIVAHNYDSQMILESVFILSQLKKQGALPKRDYGLTLDWLGIGFNHNLILQ